MLIHNQLERERLGLTKILLNLNKSEEQLLESERLLISGLPGTATEVPFPVSEFIVEVPGFKESESITSDFEGSTG